MNKIVKILLAALFVCICILIFTTIYSHTLPKLVEEINNSIIGAIITAVITVILLNHQSSSEEVRERNVRVFEKKSERFSNFIDVIWDKW